MNRATLRRAQELLNRLDRIDLVLTALTKNRDPVYLEFLDGDGEGSTLGAETIPLSGQTAFEIVEALKKSAEDALSALGVERA